MHVIPRDVGPVFNWSGKDAPDGRSPLCDYAATLDIAPLPSGKPVFNAIWFSPFTKTTDAWTHNKGVMKQGSLYGIRDHFTLDPDITSGDDEDDLRHLEHFCDQAHKGGIKVFGDLVFNHVPVDHPLVIEESKLIENIKRKGEPERIYGRSGKLCGLRGAGSGEVSYLKFVYDPKTLKPVVDGSLEQEWADVAKINYDSPAAVDCFVGDKNGKPGLWKQVIDWFLDRGFDGFRCDAAYKVPHKVWKELIDHTRERNPEAFYIAETLGGSWEEMERNIAGSGFDLCTQGTYYWDIEEDWYRQEAMTARKVARGGMGMAETHDVENSVAEGVESHIRRHFNGMADRKVKQAVAAVCLRDYALSALLGSAVCMEYGFEKQLGVGSVFREPELFEARSRITEDRSSPDHPLNISKGIRAIHGYIEKVAKCRNTSVALDKIEGDGNGTMKYTCSITEHSSGSLIGYQTVYASKKPEEGTAFSDRCDLVPSDESGEQEHTLTLGGYLAAHFTPAHRCVRPRNPVFSFPAHP